jgi:4-hydroxyphenylpyruvate dioxygenase-like putative hemolysin
VDIPELIGQLGAAGAVTAVCYWLIGRYGKLADTAIVQVTASNEARIKEAHEQTAQIERILNVQAQFMQHIALTATSMKAAAEALEAVAEQLKSRPGGMKGGDR